MPAHNDPRIAIVGLGYVGLPVAVAFAEAYPHVLGFDTDTRKIAALREGRDPNGEVDPARLRAAGLTVSDDPANLAAAGTKWNFLRFTPGLVGGHCIGVDPYYLTTKAEHLGYHPQVIIAGRRINDGMAAFLAQKTIKLLIERGISPIGARVRVLGLTFKEDVADPDEAMHEYGLALANPSKLAPAHAIVLASPHRTFLDDAAAQVYGALADGGLVIDVKAKVPRDPRVWAL